MSEKYIEELRGGTKSVPERFEEGHIIPSYTESGKVRIGYTTEDGVKLLEEIEPEEALQAATALEETAREAGIRKGRNKIRKARK